MYLDWVLFLTTVLDTLTEQGRKMILYNCFQSGLNNRENVADPLG